MSQYQIPKEVQTVQQLLDDIDDAIDRITPGSDDDIRQAAILIQGDMAIARKAASDLTEPGRSITLSISYFQEATLRYRSLSTDESSLRQALSCVNQAISYMPSPHYYILQGHIYNDLNERWEALNAMEKATKLPEAPGSEEAHKEFLKLKTRYAWEEDEERKKVEKAKKDKTEDKIFAKKAMKYCGITGVAIVAIESSPIGRFIEAHISLLGGLMIITLFLCIIGFIIGAYTYIKSEM